MSRLDIEREEPTMAEGLNKTLQRSIEGQEPSWKNKLTRDVISSLGGDSEKIKGEIAEEKEVRSALDRLSEVRKKMDNFFNRLGRDQYLKPKEKEQVDYDGPPWEQWTRMKSTFEYEGRAGSANFLARREWGPWEDVCDVETNLYASRSNPTSGTRLDLKIRKPYTSPDDYPRVAEAHMWRNPDYPNIEELRVGPNGLEAVVSKVPEEVGKVLEDREARVSYSAGTTLKSSDKNEGWVHVESPVGPIRVISLRSHNLDQYRSTAILRQEDGSWKATDEEGGRHTDTASKFGARTLTSGNVQITYEGKDIMELQKIDPNKVLRRVEEMVDAITKNQTTER